MSNFKTRFKELRSRKGVTLDEITTAIGVTTAALSRYENGHRTPTVEIAMSLAKYFNVSMDYILGLADSEKSYVSDAKMNKYIDGIMKGLKEFGYDYTDKPVDELLKLIENAIKIDEMFKKWGATLGDSTS